MRVRDLCPGNNFGLYPLISRFHGEIFTLVVAKLKWPMKIIRHVTLTFMHVVWKKPDGFSSVREHMVRVCFRTTRRASYRIHLRENHLGNVIGLVYILIVTIIPLI